MYRLIIAVSLAQVPAVVNADQVTVVMFVSARCPLTWEYLPRVQFLSQLFASKGVRFLLVDANINESGDEIQELIRQFKLTLPIYRDPGRKLVDQLGARVTPEAFLLDRTGTVRYRGSVDDARNAARIHHEYLKDAISAVLAGAEPPTRETKVLGCSIKSAE